MNKYQKISFIGFLLVSIGLGACGILYLLANKIMPFHAVAMGSSWEKLTPGIQIMSLNFMKAEGTGFLTTSIAILFLLFKPFRKGEAWSSWAILVIALNEIILILFRIIDVNTKTPARLPIIPFIIMAGIVLISFTLYFITNQKNKELKHVYSRTN